MVFKCSLFLLIFCFLGSTFGVHHARTHLQNLNPNASSLLTGIEIPNHSSFNEISDSSSSSSSSSDCGFSSPEKTETLDGRETGDVTRIQTLHKRSLEKQIRNTVMNPKKHDESSAVKLKPAVEEAPAVMESYAGKLMGTLKSGVTLGSGEYFMDVFLGTPPKHYSLILDTGSDLNWIQCTPCHDCFEQTGPHYDPQQSSSYRNISCHDRRCSLVSSPELSRPCKAEDESQSCPYFYWYGDSSNTTGDFATETFTVNLTTNVDGHKQQHKEVQVNNVMFGCGHWNRGLFHGAAGLLGLGRGPLSFASQLQSLYGHSFSYCLVDRDSNSSVSSKLIFGEDKGLLNHPELNFTSLIGGKEAPVDVFYYVHIKSVIVAGETLDIPEHTWDLTADGFGGTIIDSGTTLSYFADPAYNIIKKAFMEKVKGYPLVNDFPILEPCYNVSGIADYKKDLPSFGILFDDGAVWNFPVDNYFIKLEPEEIVCLAVLGTPRSSLSIIGNYQQQNFHIMYDTKKSRLGFAPTRCADV
ncbi:aspartyl protease family protein 2 isoform X2 [Lactuca sativa]|uniref:aspartyl protease family protein 2 isoform X2 n=1 Tax=Lactuca sativa TaxID=4236 RepID=UPI001C692949|nr:aspartyl protease family protein 2 isoform X2 [Lactuca sativa]